MARQPECPETHSGPAVFIPPVERQSEIRRLAHGTPPGEYQAVDYLRLEQLQLGVPRRRCVWRSDALARDVVLETVERADQVPIPYPAARSRAEVRPQMRAVCIRYAYRTRVVAPGHDFLSEPCPLDQGLLAQGMPARHEIPPVGKRRGRATIILCCRRCADQAEFPSAANAATVPESPWSRTNRTGWQTTQQRYGTSRSDNLSPNHAPL